MARAKGATRSSPYPTVVDLIDLPAALLAVTRNDLLPPRPDDKAGGQVGQRFVESIKRSLTVGDYEPQHSVVIPVAKPKYATRPAALLNLADRVVFQALVEPLRTRIERGLVPDSVLLWPRAKETEKRWGDFQSGPLSAPGGYIVLTDVSGFYESVDHDLLGQVLVKLTGKVDLVDALLDFLGQIMAAPRGLPQGLDTCDVLATAYLSDLDAVLLREVHHYWRSGDDIRMTVADHDAGRSAVHHLERQLRSVRLLLNADKTRVLQRETYERQMTAVDDRRSTIAQAILRDRESALSETPQNELIDLAERAGIEEQTKWDLFYHGSIGIEDVADKLRPHLLPSQVEVAAAMFEDAVLKAPGSGHKEALSDEEFHAVLTSSLTILLADRNPMPIVLSARLIGQFPDKTAHICGYLRGVAASYPAQVSIFAVEALTTGYLTGLAKAWLLTVLREVASSSAPAPAAEIEAGLQAATEIASSEDESWLARAEAARLLAQVGRLTHELLSRIWNRAPAAIHADLVAAVAVAARDDNAVWAQAFRDSLNSDPVMQVVLQGLSATDPSKATDATKTSGKACEDAATSEDTATDPPL
jgi:hypothetical protein